MSIWINVVSTVSKFSNLLSFFQKLVEFAKHE